MRARPVLASVFALAPALALALAACAQEEARAKYTFQVDFPSAPLAIATEKVQFIVYDSPEPGACQSIYLKRITGQADLPPVVLSSPEIPVCDLAGGRSPTLDLPLGRHSILAIGLRGESDLLLAGCSDVALSAEGGEVVVSLALPSTTPLPALSRCTSLGDFCADPGACK